MKGIKVHTREERNDVIDKVIPLIKSELGENLIALAVSGSFARNEDSLYSDLELLAFTKFDLKKKWELRKIVDGLLVVVVVDTKESYIKKYLDISDVWYASGCDKLVPIINKNLIDDLNSYKPDNVERKCLTQIKKRWYAFQEITAKTLNMIHVKNNDGFSIVFPQMFKELLIVLSYLNQKPYITLGSYLTQAKDFSIKPNGFDELTVNYLNNIHDLSSFEKIVEVVFSDLENILEGKGLDLYDKSLD